MAVLAFVSQDKYNDLDDKIKALTGEPTLCEKFDVVGVVGHARGSQLDLDEAVQNIAGYARENHGKEGVQDVLQIEIYADRLTALKPVRLSPTCDSLTLITRIAFVQQKRVVELELFGAPKRFTIELHCELPASPIEFRVMFANEKAPRTVTLDPAQAKPTHRHWAITFEAAGTSSVDSLSDTHTVKTLFENSTRSIADMIQDNGSLSGMGWDKYNDNLRRLLSYQMTLASKFQDEDRMLSYQVSDFVINICQGIPAAFDLYSQASTMAASKVIGQGTLIAAVIPKLDLSTAQQVLDSRLSAAATFDSAYTELQGQDSNSKNIRLFANIALEKSIDSDAVYSFMNKMTQNRLWDAQNAFNTAQREFQALQLTLKDTQEAFKKGIEEWETKQTWKTVGDVFTAITAVVGGIALACASPPAGAAGIGAGAAKLAPAIEAAGGAVGLWQKVMNITKAILKIYEKLEPYLKKIAEFVEAVNKIVDLIKSKSSVDDINSQDLEGLRLPTTDGADTVNMTADWDVFQANMNNLYDGIKDEHIAGADDFFLLTTKMVIRGKAVLTAQTALTSASDAYLTVMQQQIAQKKHTDRLHKAIPQIQGNERAFGIIKLAMAERLLTLRTWIALDFRQYLTAYAWNSLSAARPISLDPLKDLGSYRNDAATLQALSVQVTTSVRAQRRVFYISSSGAGGSDGGYVLIDNGTSDGGDNGTNNDTSLRRKAKTCTTNVLVQSGDFLDSLRTSRTAKFNLDYENPMFKNYGRLRMRRARVFLVEDAGSSERNPVSIRVTLGTEMRDLDLEKTQTPAADIIGKLNPTRVLNFVTTESVFGFEYVGKNREILMDGAFCGNDESASLLLSPFRTWTIFVASDTDLSSVTGFDLELTCEATYL